MTPDSAPLSERAAMLKQMLVEKNLYGELETLVQDCRHLQGPDGVVPPATVERVLDRTFNRYTEELDEKSWPGVLKRDPRTGEALTDIEDVVHQEIGRELRRATSTGGVASKESAVRWR